MKYLSRADQVDHVLVHFALGGFGQHHLLGRFHVVDYETGVRAVVLDHLHVAQMTRSHLLLAQRTFRHATFVFFTVVHNLTALALADRVTDRGDFAFLVVDLKS